MNHKILFFALFLITCFHAVSQEKLKVVCSASMFTDMTYQIAGDLVELKTIVPIGGDPHLHEPTPKDAKMVSSADLIFINGLTFEGWIRELIDNSGTKASVVLITEGIDVIASEKYQNSADPHAWMDASNGRIYIRNIKNALIQSDPRNKTVYETNYKIYDQELSALDTYIQKRVEEIDQNYRILITSHDAFAYYGKRYGMQLEAIQGISTEAEAQTSDIVRVSKIIDETGVPSIFMESTINPKLLQQIAKDHDVKIGGELFADSLGDEDSEAATYSSMLKHNTDAIVDALTGKSQFTSEKIAAQPVLQKVILYGIIGLLLFGGLIVVVRKLNM